MQEPISKREEEFGDFMSDQKYNLEEEFINQLPPEDRPKTDDPDETDNILMSHEEEFLNYCWEQYDEVFNNDY